MSKMTESVFSPQHNVLFLFKVKYSINTSPFSLEVVVKGEGGTSSMWYWKKTPQISFNYFLSQLDSQKLVEMKHNKDLPSISCLAVAFLSTETLLHSETFKSTNGEQNIWSEQINSQFQKNNNFLLLLQQQSRSQTTSIYEDSSWNKTVLYKPHPLFFAVYWRKDCLYLAMLRTVQQNLLLLTRKQFPHD